MGGESGGRFRTLVVIPTYDERENLASILARLHAAVPEACALVVDDASPDGTGTLADALAGADGRISVLHRAAKTGLGAAYVAGFTWALQRDFEVLVEMDADGSHAPEDLPRLLRALRNGDPQGEPPGAAGAGADVVLGSRYVPGGQVVNWPWQRVFLSRAGNLYSKLALGLDISDLTGGFRAYRRCVLEQVALHQVASQGYCFQVDLARRAAQAGFRIQEVPITFVDRQQGVSKMNGTIVREALLQVTRWGVTSRLGSGRS